MPTPATNDRIHSISGKHPDDFWPPGQRRGDDSDGVAPCPPLWPDRRTMWCGARPTTHGGRPPGAAWHRWAAPRRRFDRSRICRVGRSGDRTSEKDLVASKLAPNATAHDEKANPSSNLSKRAFVKRCSPWHNETDACPLGLLPTNCFHPSPGPSHTGKRGRAFLPLSPCGQGPGEGAVAHVAPIAARIAPTRRSRAVHSRRPLRLAGSPAQSRVSLACIY